MESSGDLAATAAEPPRALAVLEKLRERHGDVFPLRMVGQSLLVIADPELAKQVFRAPPDVLLAGKGNRRALEWLFGDNSLMLLDGRRHMRDRRLLLPPFHGHRLERRTWRMKAIAEAEITSWPAGEELAVLERLRALALDIVMSAVFGSEGEQPGPLRAALKALQVSRGGKGDGTTTFEDSLREANALIDRHVAERRHADVRGERDDVLALLLESRGEDGSALSHEEIRDELLTLVVAGTETTSSSLAWVLELLARSPKALARAVAEAPGGGGPYTDAAIYEALRMRPPVPMSALRVAGRPFLVGDHAVAPGTTLAISALLIHHRPDVYPDPFSFRPERFLGSNPDTYAWIPFGGGVRRCVGASFALLEMRIVLSALLARMIPRPASSEPEGIRNQGNTIVPSRGARFVLERRA